MVGPPFERYFQAALPGKLDAAVTGAQATPDLLGMVNSDDGQKNFFATFNFDD